LTTYGGVEKNDYTRAVGTLWLVAAVRRVRQPGCKFDELLVLGNPTQGTDRSTALAILAVKEEWFTDDLPLNVEGKRVIEATQGKGIIEDAELNGLVRAEVEHLKSQVSRQVDHGRLAYAHLPSDVPRQFIPAGTTNPSSGKYLKDDTGNRRFWPVRCGRFNTPTLRRDRDQLWAEAAALEATG